MNLPEGVSPQQWQAAIAAFTDIVGREWVFTNEDDVALYRDAYSPLWGEREERVAGAAIAPENTEQVQAIVKIAHRHGIPLYPISTGRNLGYGGSAPNLSGSVVVDLKRMNRIIEVDDERYFAIVEPGVSYFDLYRYIQERNLKVWIDVPDPGWGSVVGNALERGVGHTWNMYRDHFGSHCGMEVVTGTGDILRTGMGAMPGAETTPENRYGFGPYVDGLFSQAGFGIVTQMGFHLMPQPENALRTRISVGKREDLIPLVKIVNQMEYLGLIGMPTFGCPLFKQQFADRELAEIAARPDIWDGKAINAYARQHNIPAWTVELTFYGPRETIQGSWSHARKQVLAAIPDASFEVLEDLDFPLSAAQQEAVENKVVFGIPNLNIFSIGARSPTNPEPSDGHLLFSPVIPKTGEAVLKAQQLFSEGLRELGISSLYTYGPFVAPFTWLYRAFVLTVGFPVSRTDPAVNQRSRQAMGKLIELGARHGYGEYRAAPVFQDQVMATYNFNDHSLRRFCENLKDAADPAGIMAPGRGGFWPRRYREQNG